MPQNLPGNILTALFVGAALLALVRFLILRCFPVRTVSAVVADKQKSEVFSKYSGSGKRERYVVIFSAGNQKYSFYVSKFSYDGYRIGEKGKLTFKGNQLISFQ